jgi:hypothetical protein
LKSNEESRETVLYIVSDYAHAERHEARIREVRDYISGISGFKKVVPILREKNYGSFLSINGAIADVLMEHQQVIFLEDDNMVSTNFLRFMNDCLSFYRNDERIFSISGYQFPIKMPNAYPHHVYAWQGFSAWGVGLWLDKWKQVDWSEEAARNFVANKRKVAAMNRIGEHVVPILQEWLKRDQLVTDVLISLHLVTMNMYSVFPVVSKVRNVGHDGTGEHGHITDKYRQQAIDVGNCCSQVRDLQPDKTINKVLRKHFCASTKSRIAMYTPERVRRIAKLIFP